VTGLSELVAAPDAQRPTYVAPDLAGLLVPHAAPEPTDAGWFLGGWRSEVVGGGLRVSGAGPAEDWWRVVAAAAWTHLDGTGEPVHLSGVEVPAR